MWIAKPISKLNDREKQEWHHILERKLMAEMDVPLSQTLTWGYATESLNTQAYLIYSPDREVGGLVYAGSNTLECTNGPLLHWDGLQINEELATFANAVSQLHPLFKTPLILRPRWKSEDEARRLGRLVIQPHQLDQAATLIVSIEDNEETQESRFTDRLKRSIQKLRKDEIAYQFERLSTHDLPDLIPDLITFAQSRSFFVPPLVWFKALVSNLIDPLELYRVSVLSPDSSYSLIITRWHHTAFYLYGWPGPESDSRLATLAHLHAMTQLRILGATQYDLGGYVENAPQDHPYAGISEYKDQFMAALVRYTVPEFQIHQ